MDVKEYMELTGLDKKLENMGIQAENLECIMDDNNYIMIFPKDHETAEKIREQKISASIHNQF